MIQPLKKIILDKNINFGYRSVLKTEWLAGNLPTVKKDIYGNVLKDVTIEHIIPKSKGGKSNIMNYALANYQSNYTRSNKDILKFTTLENIRNWFLQFVGVKTSKLDGDKYIEQATKYLKKNGINLNIKG